LGAAASIALLLGLGPQSQAQEIRLNPAQAFALANQLLAQNQAEAARAIARGLLEGAPEAPELWLLLGQAERSLRNPEASRAAARNARQYAQNDLQRYNAAILTVDSHIQLEEFTRAQFWLRRARQVAPNDALKAQIARDYRLIDRVNPWSFSLSGGVRPSSNINNGSSETDNGVALSLGGATFSGGTISVDGQALSGFEARGLGTLTYTRTLAPRRSWALTARADLRRYRYTEESQDEIDAAQAIENLNPNPRQLPQASDFNFDDLRLTGTYRYPLASTALNMATSLGIGANWYGGAPLSRFANLRQAVSWNPTPRTLGEVALTYERQERSDFDERSASIWAWTYLAVWVPEAGGRLQWSLGVTDTNAKSSSTANTRYSTGLSYTLPQEILGGEWTTSLSYDYREDERPSFGSTIRQDNRYSLGLTVFLKDRELFGFAPTVSANWTQTDSTLNRFKTEDFGISLDLRSVF